MPSMSFSPRAGTISALILLLSTLDPVKANQDIVSTSIEASVERSIPQIQLHSDRNGPSHHHSFGFADILPSERVYQAIKNLAESYGCVDGYTDGRFIGNRPISRYEAAMLLKACLSKISHLTDEVKALLSHFEAELTLLNSNVDDIDSRVETLKAQSFSATTSLRVNMAMLLGGTRYTGAGADPVSSGKRNLFLPNAFNGINNGPGFPTDGLNFFYVSRLDLNTSFTGKDLLKVRMEVGNTTNSSFGINTATPLSLYAWFFPKGQGDNQIVIQRAYYSFALGEKLSVTAGPIVRQDEMLGSWPVYYPSNAPLFGVPWYAGAPAAYNLNQGAGGAVTYSEKFFDSMLAATVMYISRGGNQGNTIQGGIGTENAGATTTVQLGLTGSKWTLTGIYTHSQDNYASGNSQGTPSYYSIAVGNPMNSYGIAGFYDFNADNKLIPIINLGAGYNQHMDHYSSRSFSSWLGMMWKDLIAKGQSFGISTGQPTFLIGNSRGNADDGNYFVEAFYSVELTDNITLTPTLLWLSRPYGQQTEQITGQNSFGTLAAFVKAGIRF